MVNIKLIQMLKPMCQNFHCSCERKERKNMIRSAFLLELFCRRDKVDEIEFNVSIYSVYSSNEFDE
jgi:hypothetical protein